jgi:hypothetical protein
MAQNRRQSVRKPATKFAHLRKKMDQSKLRGNMKKNIDRKTPNK